MTMIGKLLPAVALLVLGTMVQPAAAGQTTSRSSATNSPDTVLVAPPTGERAPDRASIQAALEEVEPGGTVLFAPGMYLVGEFVRVSVPRVTLRGHPDGTTIRGCDPGAFGDRDFAVAECNGLSLTGGHQTVRNLTFEYTWLALILGGQACEAGDCPPGTLPVDARTGGYVVEQNTFRTTPNGIRVVGEWSEPALIRDNRFLNTYHAVVVRGRTAHIRDNEISVPEPARVPYTGHPGGALALVSSRITDDRTSCAGNVIAGNHIEGHPDAIVVFTQPGMTCRGHEIRDNVILVRRTPFARARDGYIQMSDDADSTVVGIPIALYNAPTDVLGPADGSRADGVIEDNVIEGNRVIGAEGIGILILRSSHNRITDNVITGVERRAPFPGNLLLPSAPLAETWQEANGSAIWTSHGSDENEIRGNTFEDISGPAVFIEGDGNRVELRSAADVVRDLGTGNRISVADGGPGHGPSTGQAVLGDSALADTLLSLTDDLAASWTRLEPDDYLDRFSDDLVFYFEGSRVSRSEFEAVVRGTMEALAESTFEVSDPDVEILGPDAAVISFGLREVMVDRNGDVTDLRGALTLVWERREGEWRVVRAHESLPPANDGGR